MFQFIRVVTVGKKVGGEKSTNLIIKTYFLSSVFSIGVAGASHYTD